MFTTTEAKKIIWLFIMEILGDSIIMNRGKKHSGKYYRISSGVESNAPKIIVVGCPIYGNLGDQAIALAEKVLIENNSSRPVLMFYGPVSSYWRDLENEVNPDDTICLQGGGNMGTLYQCFEDERLAIIDKFRRNRIIVFPQTFSYGNTIYDRMYVKHMERIYTNHMDLHIVAREPMSLERMKRHFPSTDILLTPDTVLSLPPLEPVIETKREGALLCLRDDKEKIARSGENELEAILTKRYGRVSKTDTIHANKILSPAEGETAVYAKINEFTKARIVVTDRIHGMIFCALSGTPCIALDNSNGKVGQEYGWLKKLSYMRFAHSLEEAASIVQRSEIMPGRFPTQDFSPLFTPIIQLL